MFLDEDGADYRAAMNPEFVRRALARREEDRHKREARRLFKANGAPEWVIDIVLASADGYGVSPIEIAGGGRTKAVTKARNAAIYEAKARRPAVSCPLLGKYFGRNSSTILFSLASHADATGLPALTTYQLDKQRRRMAAASDYQRRKARAQHERHG